MDDTKPGVFSQGLWMDIPHTVYCVHSISAGPAHYSCYTDVVERSLQGKLRFDFSRNLGHTFLYSNT